MRPFALAVFVWFLVWIFPEGRRKGPFSARYPPPEYPPAVGSPWAPLERRMLVWASYAAGWD